MRRAAALLALAALAACGREQMVKPRPGEALPPQPATAPAQPMPAELMQPQTQARPQRTDELLTRPDTRPDDRFDLPPPG